MSIEQQIKESVQTLEIIGGSLYDKQSARGFLEDNALKIGRMLIDAQSIISKQAEEIANLEQKLDTAKYKDCGHTKDPGMYCRTCHVKELQKLSSQQAEEIKRLRKQLPQPKRKCVACNGSGRYDSKGSPPCGACDGTGYEEDESPC